MVIYSICTYNTSQVRVCDTYFTARLYNNYLVRVKSVECRRYVLDERIDNLVQYSECVLEYHL